jgi:signal transduction histidine kinase
VNLVNNAIDATLAVPAEPGTVPYVAVRVAREPRGGTIAVEDRGVGAPLDVERRLFEPFFTTKPAGTGLGLMIARAVAERHGGRLDYARNPGRGMTFTLTLPERARP